MREGEEVRRSTDSGHAGIVGVIFTLEHTRRLVAGRSCSLVADTGMVTHERFWAEFLGASSSMCQVIVCSNVLLVSPCHQCLAHSQAPPHKVSTDFDCICMFCYVGRSGMYAFFSVTNCHINSDADPSHQHQL